ncbi:MAG: hypothetical protein AAF658_21955, partial [Myxococcota bacterium]
GLIPRNADGVTLVVINGPPRQYYYLEVLQNIGRDWRVTARYGYQDYERIDPDNRWDVGRYRYYHQFRVKAEYRF